MATAKPNSKAIKPVLEKAAAQRRTSTVFKTLAAAAKRSAPATKAVAAKKAEKKEASAAAAAATKRELTKHRVKYMELTGQTPLEFLTAVYRNQLYDAYQTVVVDERRGLSRAEPLQDEAGNIVASQIYMSPTSRMAAAIAAAPYVHRKQPIGIDGGEGKPLIPPSTESLKNLNEEELDLLIALQAKLTQPDNGGSE